MAEGKLTPLEEEALKRKERLKALKRKHETGSESVEEPKNVNPTPLPKPKFRSYKPQDEQLKESVMPSAKPADVTEEVKEQLAAADSRVVMDDLDITTLAPRKPDWDLKRDVAKKLEKLEKRTQRAIAELIRDRLRSEQGDDLASAVNIGARAQLAEANDDD
ncbi:Coiled-coil domain-containing protein 12 [Frankliniella fusca]|uniref:Coiled-coil domain-containing protein 12 n=1 Tax=Frankliniella fusca TaxID=407009 RepID=A0AAE1GSL4_9NEOP|nr:Coiled-coil domain-containing protein 12 [Frankliniella fusca]